MEEATIGEERWTDGKWYVWVVCPDCRNGRWVAKVIIKRGGFTGRCRDCYLVIARREMGKYYPFNPRAGKEAIGDG